MHQELKWLRDILDSISLINTYIKDKQTPSAFKDSMITIDAVERRLTIIGGALWQIDKINNTLKISDKDKIISLWHTLVHDYDMVDSDKIWTMCKKLIPVLKEEVEAILKTTN